METESNTQTSVPRLVTDTEGFWASVDRPHALTVFNGSDDRYECTVRLSTRQVAAIVQLAYDQLGILAEPSFERECPPDTLQVAHNMGARA